MTKGPNLQRIWNDLSEDRKERIKDRAQALEEEYLTLQKLRKVTGLTQEGLSKQLNMRQENISRLEKRSDMLLSTLLQYVEAVGGKLILTVEMPNRPPIQLSGLGDLLDNGKCKPEAKS